MKYFLIDKPDCGCRGKTHLAVILEALSLNGWTEAERVELPERTRRAFRKMYSVKPSERGTVVKFSNGIDFCNSLTFSEGGELVKFEYMNDRRGRSYSNDCSASAADITKNMKVLIKYIY